MNHAEVIHAGCAHQDHSNLSLLEASNMDTRDTILLEAHMSTKKGRRQVEPVLLTMKAILALPTAIFKSTLRK